MSRNGAGVYSLPAGNPVVTLTAISTSWANGTLTDIANEITNSIDKGGRTAPTANLPMAGFKHTGAGDGSAAGQYLAYGQATAAVLTQLQVSMIGAGIAPIANVLYAGSFDTGAITLAAQFTGYGTSPSIVQRLASGSLASPGATQLNTNPLNLVGGTTADGTTFFNTVAFAGYAEATTTVGSHPTYAIISTTPAGSTTRVERLRITSDGRLYGTALHNNAGAVTGTANQYIASGTYTPTLTSVLNVTSTSARVCNWLRVGNIVHVSGQCEIDPTTGLSQTQVDISLPIASALSATAQLSGAGAATNNSPGAFGNILGNSGSDRASLFFWAPSSPPNDLWSWAFSYEVL